MLVYVSIVMLTNTFLILNALEFVTLTQLSIILAIQFTVQAVADYPTAAIADWIGQRWILFTAALSYGAGFVLLSQASDFASVLIAFIFIGFALSQESGTFISWFDNNYKLYAIEDGDRRSYSMFYGRFTMLNEIMTAISFVLGGTLIALVGRSIMFEIQGILLILVSIMFLFFIRDHELIKHERKDLKSFFQYLRGGIAVVSQSRTLSLMIIGLIISGFGFSIWGGLILFPLYADYAKTDIATAILRSALFILGALGAGFAGIISKRIHKLQKWLSLAVLLVDVTFFLGIFMMLNLNPAPATFSMTSILIVLFTFTFAFSPRYLADVLKPRFYLDVIPDQNRNAVYSLIPTLILIVSIPAVPIGGYLIETLGLNTVILILALNGLIGSSITAYAIYNHHVVKRFEDEAVELCCPVFPSKMTDTQSVIPLTLPCCWSFDPITQYIWLQLQETAKRDKIISEDEQQIIEKIILDVESYGHIIEESLKEGRITSDERQRLLNARDEIWIDAYNVATTNHDLSQESKDLLITLARLLKYLDADRIFRV